MVNCRSGGNRENIDDAINGGKSRSLTPSPLDYNKVQQAGKIGQIGLRARQ
ncbi:MAG: hypothetical protein N3E45_00760 [Oscillatoriaceae bacterium SKW80]|nr:hypothetical protein [Oscillatoriaceae bacterium SKYG93]MCX8119360.1 hypothetical protein [Oscillatoriaceae bacterium SKW80]MDW8454827.1 hypothetical protein [Oscillatoriaceae cyanobacterium SKYGB_i_bin93]HIK28393.1 hypothetical protein [Oscillatoriaceae cyanobacterium M7585_C2015_266]